MENEGASGSSAGEGAIVGQRSSYLHPTWKEREGQGDDQMNESRVLIEC